MAILRELCKWVEGPFRDWFAYAIGLKKKPEKIV
ncbi:hypothetical protein PpBr36_02284 [Pyricularia pennisetigena]|nr:hypothetical protein PpBr36_02284 [Pyricularia pennisetigena]TLS30177.1 hypothetical protein PpBr36_02284 [Pyricularia pennisetigena]